MALPFPASGTYAITPPFEGFDQLIKQVELVLQGGIRVLQLRDKQRRASDSQAQELLQLCHAYGVPLIINDDLDLALRIGADGVHLGKEDLSIQAGRQYLGPEAIIGISCYGDLQRAITACENHATYVAFGAFFPSSTKPQAPRVSKEILQQAKQKVQCPVVAIGGITPTNGKALLQAGTDLLAVINGIFGQPNPKLAAMNYNALFEGNR
ncbi:MAG: hypothetical protein AXA67_11500 [Methylothermaceae bacteria B42]|nr:MAG: hypothetical protein AXA67_11500 [Methylothermaceae bacteria B42]HHJ39154.1 thiamine phosphate synthase [Methylothermaceae bacterium]